jgi:hypothetical protein
MIASHKAFAFVGAVLLAVGLESVSAFAAAIQILNSDAPGHRLAGQGGNPLGHAELLRRLP